MSLELDIGRVRSVRGRREHFCLTAEAFDFMSADWRLSAPLTVEAELSHQGEFLQLSCRVRAEVEGRCDRCLEPVRKPVDVRFVELLLRAEETARFADLAVGELEEKYVLYADDILDITDLVREHILEVLPQKILCREDCRGLCPKCGQNLNLGQCDCDLHEVDPRFAVLATLRDSAESRAASEANEEENCRR